MPVHGLDHRRGVERIDAVCAGRRRQRYLDTSGWLFDWDPRTPRRRLSGSERLYDGGWRTRRRSALSPNAAIAGLFTAGVLVAFGVFLGYPIATAFTVTGAITGVGLALRGIPNWPVYRQTLAVWALVPFVGGGTAYATARLLRTRRISTTGVVAILTGVTALVVLKMGFLPSVHPVKSVLWLTTSAASPVASAVKLPPQRSSLSSSPSGSGYSPPGCIAPLRGRWNGGYSSPSVDSSPSPPAGAKLASPWGRSFRCWPSGTSR